MTPAPVPPAPTHEITLDEIRHKALRIRDDVQDEVREQVTSQTGRAVIIGAVAIVALVSIAYFMGARAAAARRA